MNRLSRFNRLPAIVALATATVLGATACGANKTNANPNKPGTPNVEVVAASGYVGNYEQDAQSLNNWLGRHVSERVISFTGILADQSENSGYELVVTPGSNNDEEFDFVSTQIEPDVLPAPSVEVQRWLGHHPNRHLLGLTSIPAYRGGAEGYVILSALNVK